MVKISEERDWGEEIWAEVGGGRGEVDRALPLATWDWRHGILTRLFLKQFGNLLITLTQSLGRPGNQV